MAAVCELIFNSQTCEVAAIGRCSVCGHAFCASHRAVSDRIWVDWCTSCQREDDAASQRQQEWYGPAFLKMHAREMLAKSTLTPFELVHCWTEVEKGRLGSRYTAVKFRPIGWIWPIGVFRWSYYNFAVQGGADSEIEQDFLTVIVDRPIDGLTDPVTRSCGRAYHDTRIDRFVGISGGNARLRDEASVAAAIRGLLEL